MQPEFKFKSEFSQLVRRTLINSHITMWKVAQVFGCEPHIISAYYSDKKILTSEHAQAFSDLLKSLDVNYTADELMQMQKQAEFIVCDNRSVAEILMLE